jgi:hypothetical protein
MDAESGLRGRAWGRLKRPFGGVSRAGWIYAILLSLCAVVVFAIGWGAGYLLLLVLALPCSLIVPLATFLTGWILEWLPAPALYLVFGVEVLAVALVNAWLWQRLWGLVRPERDSAGSAANGRSA